MKAAGKGKVYDLWQQAGGKKSGTWPDLFGWSAGELMSAWSIAVYHDGVAEAGKAIHDIPMYINAGMMEHRRVLKRWGLPGESYRSGEAVYLNHALRRFWVEKLNDFQLILRQGVKANLL